MTAWAVANASDNEGMAAQSRPVEASRRPPRAALIVVGMAGFAWVAGGFASFTWQALASVLVGGAVVAVLGTRGSPRRRRVGGRPRGMSAWVIWAAALLAWWGSAFLTGSRPSHPTLSLLLDPLLQVHPVKSIAFLAWMLAGWALLRR